MIIRDIPLKAFNERIYSYAILKSRVINLQDIENKYKVDRDGPTTQAIGNKEKKRNKLNT